MGFRLDLLSIKRLLKGLKNIPNGLRPGATIRNDAGFFKNPIPVR